MKEVWQWLIRYQSFRYRILWEPVALSITTVGIFVCLFEDKLLIEIDQDALRNLGSGFIKSG